MSHHLDSPLSRRDPRLDLTDLYVFGTPDATVLALDVDTSLADGAPGFHPDARYEFRVQLDGTPSDALTYRFSFGAEDGDAAQPFEVRRLTGTAAADPSADGEVVLRGRTAGAGSGAGLRGWAGRVPDPFFLDLRLLQAMNAATERDAAPPLDGLRTGEATSSFSGATVNAVVLEVPHSDAELRPGRQLHVWAAVLLATDAGGWQQVNRAGLPMIWPVFRPADGEPASEANTTHPSQDPERYGKDLATTAAALVAAAGTAADPESYGRALADRLLPDLLPYVVGEPACFGFNGFQGRTLDDDAAGVMFSLVTNSGIPTGLRARDARPAPGTAFPYVAVPYVAPAST